MHSYSLPAAPATESQAESLVRRAGLVELLVKHIWRSLPNRQIYPLSGSSDVAPSTVVKRSLLLFSRSLSPTLILATQSYLTIKKVTLTLYFNKIMGKETDQAQPPSYWMVELALPGSSNRKRSVIARPAPKYLACPQSFLCLRLEPLNHNLHTWHWTTCGPGSELRYAFA